jgi:fibronectin type 3 domain-containing protein
VVLDFTGDRLDLQFLDSTGVVRDNFAIVKNAGGGPPSAPTGLAAAPGNNQVSLTWNASPGATSYQIKRALTSGGPYAILASGVSGASYVDSTAQNGTAYFYVVNAVNDAGESANSSEVSATPSAPTAPAAPTSLIARANGKKKIRLDWIQSPSANVVSNKVYLATSSAGPFNPVATVPATTTYNSAGLSSGTTYYYIVTALNGSGQESAASNVTSATAR